MRKSTRLLFLLGVFEAGLLVIGLWLMHGLQTGDLRPVNSISETAGTVWSVLGGVMGALAGVFGVAAFVLRRKGQ